MEFRGRGLALLVEASVSELRNPSEKAAIAIAAAATAWVIGTTMFYRSRGLNLAGFLPSAACLVALWGAVRSDVRAMWWGTVFALALAGLFIFSLGLVIAPAALALVVGAVALTYSKRATA